MAKSRVRRTSRWLVALPAGLAGALFGFVFGAAAFAFSGAMGGDPPSPRTALVVAAATGVTAFLLRALLIEGSADFARRLFMGGDEGTSPEYSVACGLEVAGRYEEALAAYLTGAEEYPDDPTPLIQGAYLLRNNLDRPEEAVALLRRAGGIPEIDQRDRNRIDQELVALFTGPLDQKHRALPILARMTETQAGTRPGQWAALRLARLRSHLWEEVGDAPAPDRSHYHREVTGSHGDPPARPGARPKPAPDVGHGGLNRGGPDAEP